MQGLGTLPGRYLFQWRFPAEGGCDQLEKNLNYDCGSCHYLDKVNW